VTFRAGLLDGRRVALAGAGAPVAEHAGRLGAWVDTLEDTVLRDEDAAAAWVSERAPLHAIVFDAAAAFGAGGAPGLASALRQAWLATRPVAAGALIPQDGPGKVVLIAPRTGAGPHVEAARAGLENLVRTLSVEWARFAVTTVAVCPGSRTTDTEIAELVCYLLSDAGAYLSGCRFELDGVGDLVAGPAPSEPGLL
jgi:NAD(P)-dependent dehydrogenase (short-subunit alcohol dehydrogenase family)